MALAGCSALVGERCPDCRVVDARPAALPPLKPGTRELFVLVPGMLGYGWEWEAAVRRLQTTPGIDFVVFWWNGWVSFDRSARELAELLERVDREAPSGVTEVTVVAHSAAGMVAGRALGHLRPPTRRLRLVTVGTPFAGMHICPVGESDVVHAPLMMSIAADFRRYPAVPAGVEVVEYVTRYPADPVMHPYWGRRAAPPSVGPRRTRRVEVDATLDHNLVLDAVMRDLVPVH